MLWDEVPPEKRISRQYLMGSPAARGPKWKEDMLALAERPRCREAVLWSEEDGIYRACRVNPAPGEKFCYHHGGAARPKRKKRLPTSDARALRFHIRRIMKGPPSADRLARYLDQDYWWPE